MSATRREHIYVIYDSVENPVFESQVLRPIIEHLTQNPTLSACLISFEKLLPTDQKIDSLKNLHARFTVIFFKKYPFLGAWSLFTAIRILRTFLEKYATYRLQARGPFAGYVCLKALSWKHCLSLVIQARGLAAAEYEYVHRLHKRQNPSTWLHHLRLRFFNSLERTVYSYKTDHPFFIEIVSLALQDYLIAHFKADQNRCVIAKTDIPVEIDQKQCLAWHQDIRNLLNIPLQTFVYCYNGSAMHWQCPEETILFFKKQYEADQACLLLILTHDITSFKKLLLKYTIPASAYRLVSVQHQEVYRYLAAADAGIIFREHHLMNWISRPTKALEYWAVRLPIIHNRSVAMLTHE